MQRSILIRLYAEDPTTIQIVSDELSTIITLRDHHTDTQVLKQAAQQYYRDYLVSREEYTQKNAEISDFSEQYGGLVRNTEVGARRLGGSMGYYAFYEMRIPEAKKNRFYVANRSVRE